MSTASACCPEHPARCGCGCGDPAAADPLPAERNRYFTGKYMTARDFTAEQAYFLSRHRLHQKALHGAGIVCGLDVVPHPDADCARRGFVVVTPGIALDSHGREVVVRSPLPVNLAGMTKYSVECGRHPEYPAEGNQTLLLGVYHTATGVEAVPVMADEDGCAPRKDFNRVREGSAVGWLSWGEGKDCWGRPKRANGCAPSAPAAHRSLADVLGPLCDHHCGGFVPLAKLLHVPFTDVDDHGKSGVVVDLPEGWHTKPQQFIDKTGRRHLPGPLDTHQLTHICRVNWWHGEKVPLDHLKREYAAGRADDERAGRQQSYERHNRHHHPHHEWVRLTVAFDRRLAASLPPVEPAGKVGFYERFLRVRYETVDGGRVPLSRHAVAHLSHDRTRLHYDVHLHCLQKMREHVQDPVIHVTLDCDFLTDEFGRAVDGDHLYASLRRSEAVPADEHPLLGPTGDGVEGGVFESWFQLDW